MQAAINHLTKAATISILGATALYAHSAPGIPQAPTTIFTEDFQNQPPATSGTILSDYIGATGQTYTANPAWLTACNGLLSSADQPQAGADGQTTSCGSQEAWNVTQQLAKTLGAYQSSANSDSNFAVSAYTSADPGANLVEFETENTIPLSSAKRFVAASIDVAAANCYRASAPLLQFYLLDGGIPSAAGNQVDGCTGSLADMPALGAAAASTGSQGARVGTYRSGGVLVEATAVGLRITNANGSGTGNDHAFDNILLLDVSPTLDKAFNPISQNVGGNTTLTFTITNTSELGQKAGWSFTDSLPSGLVVATPPAISTSCADSVVAAPAGGSSIVVEATLSEGMSSCNVSVNVTSATAGSYTNGPDNIVSAGLNPPQVSVVTFTPPVVVNPPSPTPVPTLEQWGLISLGSLLAIFGVSRLRRRQG
ncbi:MAG: IPTL-CTERM sorting domain-containing protein [Comamonas sp.]|uniref:IPTL-CTERM sorting domain-containing protein n=1 Tax=unclassified Comamonas TaxID=2638500 RepID=UPI0035944DDC